MITSLRSCPPAHRACRRRHRASDHAPPPSLRQDRQRAFDEHLQHLVAALGGGGDRGGGGGGGEGGRRRFRCIYLRRGEGRRRVGGRAVGAKRRRPGAPRSGQMRGEVVKCATIWSNTRLAGQMRGVLVKCASRMRSATLVKRAPHTGRLCPVGTCAAVPCQGHGQTRPTGQKLCTGQTGRETARKWSNESREDFDHGV